MKNFSIAILSLGVVFKFFVGELNAENLNEEVKFYSLDVSLDGKENSKWISAEFTFKQEKSPAEVEYLNLKVDDDMKLYSIPINLKNLKDRDKKVRFHFKSSNEDEKNGDIYFLYTLSKEPNSKTPESEKTSTVQLENYKVSIYSGINKSINSTEVNNFNLLDSANNFALKSRETRVKSEPLIGGEVVSTALNYSSYETFPNQEAGVNECVPTAVSNSMFFLKHQNGLVVDDNKISIDSMKNATDWQEGGSPLNWWITKSSYMETNGFPIITEQVSISNIDVLQDRFEKRCDIEMVAHYGSIYHSVAVVEVLKLTTGDYSTTIVHDVYQNGIGGTVSETFFITPSGIIEGSYWATNLDYFVTECIGININSGWNLISPPLNGTISLAVLKDDYSDISTVYEYSNGSYISNPTTLEAGKGYWLKSNSSFNMRVSPTTISSTDFSFSHLNLNSGWNLLGTPYEVSKTTIENEISVRSIWAYDSATQNWSTSQYLNAGDGFWAYK